MISHFKKHLLLICVISSYSALFAMDNQEKQSPPAAKIKKLDQSSSCVSTGQPALPPAPLTPVSDVSQRPQCPSVSRFDRPSKKRSPERQDLQRATSRRRALNFDDSAPVFQTESAITPPTAKCLRADAPPVAQDPVNQVLTAPYILPNIFQYLEGPDLCRFVRVSKACAAATQENLMRENAVANALQKKVRNPISYVLGKAQGRENVRVCGLRCNTCALVKLLQEKGSLLSESISASLSANFTYMVADKANTPLPKTVTTLSPEELFALKPTKYIGISDNEMTEDQLVEYVKKIAEQFPDYTISLDLSPPSDNDQLYDEPITASLTKKLAQYPIISLNCQEQEFPQGLACLSVLHTLRSLTISNCSIADNAIPDELCEGLPFLTTLQVMQSGITSVSPAIEKLKNLAVLDLFANNITKLPDTLRNLHLKTLNVIQEERTKSAQLSAILPPIHTLKNLSFSYRDRRDPLTSADGDYLAQMESLVLRGNIGTLRRHYKQLQNLKKLVLFTAENHSQLPSCISELPALQELRGILDEDTIINYETLLFIARQLQTCSIFSQTTEDMPAIKAIVNLWQFIQMNHELISTKLKELNDSQRLNYRRSITITKFLMKTRIEVCKLRYLIADPSKCTACFEFLRNIVLTQYQQLDGSQEAQAASNQFRPNDESFARAIEIIAQNMCQHIPVYSSVGSSTKATSANRHLTDQLNSIAAAINQIMEMIGQGNVISENQFRSCITQLNLPVNNAQYIVNCTFTLANLFFYHAIKSNAITNATFMLKHGAFVNSVYGPNYDTPLHCAIKNRVVADNENLRQQIDRVIYFLIKNGASFDQQNNEHKTPLELIPLGSPLIETFKTWRPRK